MYMKFILLTCLISLTQAKDELSTFHYTNDGELVYYQGYSTKTLNYTEAVRFCHLMGGSLPTSFEHIFPLILASRHDSDLFWLGPVKGVNETDYIWPNGAKFVHSEVLKTNKDCLDGRCCAVAAKWAGTSAAGRHLDYIEKSCYLIHHPVCVIKNTLGEVASQVNRINDRHQTLRQELSSLLPSPRAALLASHDTSLHHRGKREARNFIKNEATGKVYHYDGSIGTYDDSVEYCEKLGGVLSPVSTQDDANFLVGVLGRYRDAWLGSTKNTQSKQKYSWLDGTPINPQLWQVAPSSDAEYALSLSSYPQFLGQVREVPCDRTYRRFCLMNSPTKPTTPVTEPTRPITPTPPTPVTAPTQVTPSTSSPVSTFKPGTGVDEKLDDISGRLQRQEKLLHDLIGALKKAFNGI